MERQMGITDCLTPFASNIIMLHSVTNDYDKIEIYTPLSPHFSKHLQEVAKGDFPFTPSFPSIRVVSSTFYRE